MDEKSRQAADFLPEPWRSEVMALPDSLAAEEFRFYAGQPARLRGVGGQERTLCARRRVKPDELSQILERASGSSVHSVMEGLRNGYLTLPGGHRLGLGGAAIMEQGQMKAMKHISSLNLRVARDVKGIAEPMVRAWLRDGIPNALIVSPPGGGKTTLLRDMIRQISDGGQRVSVADERGEIAAMYRGQPQLDIGARTDVLEGCAKASAALTLLRAMSPDVLALDEVTAPADVDAIRMAAYCGVSLLATAHGRNEKEIFSRPVYKPLWDENLFSQIIFIDNENGARRFRVTSLYEGGAA